MFLTIQTVFIKIHCSFTSKTKLRRKKKKTKISLILLPINVMMDLKTIFTFCSLKVVLIKFDFSLMVLNLQFATIKASLVMAIKIFVFESINNGF